MSHPARFAVGLTTLVCAAMTARAGGEPDDQPGGKPEVAERQEDRTDWDAMPAPDASSGVEVDGDPEPSPLVWIPRGLLFVPRLVWEVTTAPIRGGVYVTERYKLRDRAIDLFFNDSRTFGIYPTAAFRSGFGVSGGAHLVYKNALDSGVKLDVDAQYGGRYQQSYTLELEGRSGALASLHPELELSFERRPKERFFGIGNGDLTDPGEVLAAVDPAMSDLAVSTRFREDRLAARLGGGRPLGDAIAIKLRAGYERRTTRDPESIADTPLTDIYVGAVGFDEVLHALGGELELRYDSRAPAGRFTPTSMPSAGSLASLVAAYQRFPSSTGDDFVQVAIDLQHHVDLYAGSRVLGLRVLATQISADVAGVPFVYLPSLGGEDLLRGYQTGRFRDRSAVLASAEYKWELAVRHAAAFVFADVGRVQSSLDEIDLDRARIGFGGGLQLHTLDSFIARVHLASSIDGGLFLNLDFSPVIDARVRE
jgi:hypothetical protein